MDLLTGQVPLYVGHSSETLELAPRIERGLRAYHARALPLSYASGAGAAIRTPITDLRGPRSSH